MEALLNDIEAYCSEAGMSLSEFGGRAMGDRGFVFGLRKGRQCLPSTVCKARNFMKDNPSDRTSPPEKDVA